MFVEQMNEPAAQCGVGTGEEQGGYSFSCNEGNTDFIHFLSMSAVIPTPLLISAQNFLSLFINSHLSGSGSKRFMANFSFSVLSPNFSGEFYSQLK